MQFYRLSDGTAPNIEEIRQQNPSVGIPDNPENLSDIGYEKYLPTDAPTVGKFERAKASGNYVLNNDGFWVIDWEIVSWSQAEINEYLTNAKTRIWESIKAERDRRAQNGINVDGNWYHSDSASRIQQLGLKDRARDVLAAGGDQTSPILILGQNVAWQSMSGTSEPLTVKLAFDLVKAIGDLDAILFSVAKYHRANMEASPDPENYNFSQGWPPTFVG